MKIAYVIGPSVFSNTNGIRSQAIKWADILGVAGHDVTFVDNWNTYKWKEFDIVHFFGSGGTWFSELAKILYPANQNLVWSPICDEISNPYLQRLKTLLGVPFIQLSSPPFIRRKSYHFFKGVFVRSDYESNFLQKAYSVDSEKIHNVPLAPSYHNEIDISEKEPFCFHLSSFTQQRKNVVRLIEAAKKYEFKLIVAGNPGDKQDYHKIKSLSAGFNNIKILGILTEEEKLDFYRRAKVFALPSLNEGVGIVALDAAHFGCDIVMTNIGGPKEYYGQMAFTVNPYNIDSIGTAISKAMTTGFQPQLKAYIDANFSTEIILKKLEQAYHKILNLKITKVHNTHVRVH